MFVSTFEKLRTLLYRLARISNAVGTLMIFGLVGVLNVDVVARGAFHAPLKGSVELVIFAMVLIVFLQLPDVVRINRLTRSDGFIAVLQTKYPLLADIASRIIDASACIFMALVAWAVWPEFMDKYESCYFFAQPEFGPAPTGEFMKDLSDAWARCDYFGTPGVFTAPKWPLHLATFFGVTLCSLIFGVKSILGQRKLTMIHLEKSEKNPEKVENE